MYIWLVGCFGLNGPLRQYFSLYRAVSQRGRRKREHIEERKNVQTSPPAPTASAIDPCPTIGRPGTESLPAPSHHPTIPCRCTRGYQKVLSLTWKEPEIWIFSALFFNVVPFQLHTLVPSSYPVINTRSVEVNILVPSPPLHSSSQLTIIIKSPAPKVFFQPRKEIEVAGG